MLLNWLLPNSLGVDDGGKWIRLVVCQVWLIVSIRCWFVGLWKRDACEVGQLVRVSITFNATLVVTEERPFRMPIITTNNNKKLLEMNQMIAAFTFSFTQSYCEPTLENVRQNSIGQKKTPEKSLIYIEAKGSQYQCNYRVNWIVWKLDKNKRNLEFTLEWCHLIRTVPPNRETRIWRAYRLVNIRGVPLCVRVCLCVCASVSRRRLIGRATLLSNAYRSAIQPFPENTLQSPLETLFISPFVFMYYILFYLFAVAVRPQTR